MITRDNVFLILQWFVDKHGQSKYSNSIPKLKVYKSKGTGDYRYKSGLRGYYNSNSNTINIFLGSIESILDLCKCVAHEYKHYLSSSREYDKIDEKLKNKGFNIDQINENHPHEKRCRKFEEKWGVRCYKELKHFLTKI